MTCIKTMAERFIRCAIRGYSDSAVWHKKTMMIFIPPQMKPVYMGTRRELLYWPAVTVTEYLTYPYQQNDMKMINSFYSFIEDMEIEIKNIDKRIAEKAAKIRAEYKFFKSMDALQLATACINKCDLFLTNDKQLKQFKEIKCVTVDEL